LGSNWEQFPLSDANIAHSLEIAAHRLKNPDD